MVQSAEHATEQILRFRKLAYCNPRLPEIVVWKTCEVFRYVSAIFLILSKSKDIVKEYDHLLGNG
jgi:hypothetical protein